MPKRKTQEEFITEAISVHGNKYDYDMVIYINNKTKVWIWCHSCQDYFQQKPNRHLNSNGCDCYKPNNKITYDMLVKRGSIKHNNKYTYPLQNIGNNKSIINITCNIHGDFTQELNSHLSGNGCRKCYDDKKTSNKEEFVFKSNIKHDDFYDYTNFIYVDSITYGMITCPNHGDFPQKPNDHLSGRGCPSCNTSKGEKIIKKIFDDNNIEYIQQKIFDGCVYINKLKYDFYLPQLNICIEYNGEQHYNIIEYFGGEGRLLKQQERDKIKQEYCVKNNIELLIIRYDENTQEKLKQIIIFNI